MLKFIVGLLLLSSVANAQELDPKFTQAPAEVVVREDMSGNRDVFKVVEPVVVKSESDAAVVVEKFVTEDNKINSLVAESELDRVSSVEAWYYWGWSNYGWNYGYRWYNNYYWYRPYYSWSWGNYNYYYYRWW